MQFYIFVIGAFLLLSNLGASPVQTSNENGLDFIDEFDAKFSISNIWQKVKESLKKAWNNIQEAAKITVEKLKEWIYAVKLKADEILEKVKDNLNKLKEDIKDRLEEFAKQSKEIAAIVQKCYKEHEKDIDDIINNTVKEIGKCIMENKNEIARLEQSVQDPLTEELFIEDLKKRLDLCVKDEKSLDFCLLNIEGFVLEEIYMASKEVLKNENETKNVLNDILDKLMKCATDGIMKASEKLSKKVVDIGKCINKEIEDKNHSKNGSQLDDIESFLFK